MNTSQKAPKCAKTLGWGSAPSYYYHHHYHHHYYYYHHHYFRYRYHYHCADTTTTTTLVVLHTATDFPVHCARCPQLCFHLRVAEKILTVKHHVRYLASTVMSRPSPKSRVRRRTSGRQPDQNNNPLLVALTGAVFWLFVAQLRPTGDQALSESPAQ